MDFRLGARAWVRVSRVRASRVRGRGRNTVRAA